VTILGVADSFVTNINLTGEDARPLMTGEITHQVPIVAGNSNFAYGAGGDNAYYPQTTGDQLARESASVNMGRTPIWPGDEAYQWKTPDQSNGNPSEQVGFFDVIRSLTNVFTGLVGRVNSPTVQYSPMEAPTPSEVLVSQHSEEDIDDDFFDDKAVPLMTDVPISVRLAQVKQLVKSRFTPRSPSIYDGHPQYAPVEIRDSMSSQGPAYVHQDAILMPGEHVSENVGCNSRLCLWKK
jgi:hypothetical protein